MGPNSTAHVGDKGDRRKPYLKKRDPFIIKIMAQGTLLLF